MFFNCDNKEYLNFYKTLSKLTDQILISPIHDYFSNNSYFIYLKKFNKFLKENNKDYFLNEIKNIELKNKKCFYNEFDILLQNNKLIISYNNCFSKKLNQEIVNKELNKKNLKIINNSKKIILCNDSCPYDYAFYGSVQ
jgi:hypothetical protein